MTLRDLPEWAWLIVAQLGVVAAWACVIWWAGR
jgi:hypothetical protein